MKITTQQSPIEQHPRSNSYRGSKGNSLSLRLGGSVFLSRLWLMISVTVIYMLIGCAYYNTFYNAKQEFKAAEKERKNRKGEQPSSKENAAYSKAIEKASKILELYSKSKYVDDALLMLGKCFYYQQQYPKAERKFEELILLYGTKGLANEALLWRTKTRIELKKFDNAAADCRKILNSRDNHDFIEEAQFLMAEILFAKKDYTLAAEEFTKVSNKIHNKEIRAKAFARLGECYLELQDYPSATDAFRAASHYSPSMEFRYASLLNMGKAQKLQGRNDEAIRTFNKLLNEESAKEYWPDVELHVAESIQQKGEMDNAIKWYESIIEEYPKTDAAARSCFSLGQIHEQHFGDYAKANENYNQAEKEFPRSEIVKLASAKSNDIEKLLNLKTYITNLRAKAAQADSAGKQQATKQDSLGAPHRPDKDDAPAATKSAELKNRAQPSSLPQEAESMQDEKISRQSPAPSESTLALETALLQLGELFYFQFSRPDSALEQYWAAYEASPEGQVGAQALYSIAFIHEKVYKDSLRADSLLTEVIDKFPNSPQADGARRHLGILMYSNLEDTIAKQFYEAERALWNENNCERAVKIYKNISENYSDSEFAAKALFVQGWISENYLDDNQRAYEIYKHLVETYPKSKFTRKVRPKIDAVDRQAQADKENAAAADSAIVAQTDSLAKQEQEPNIKPSQNVPRSEWELIRPADKSAVQISPVKPAKEKTSSKQPKTKLQEQAQTKPD